MLYSTLLRAAFRRIYGGAFESPAGDGAVIIGDGDGMDPGACEGLVVVADGVGGLNLLGASLQHVLTRAGMTHRVWIVSWGHGFGRWHADLTNVSNHVAQAGAILAGVERFRARHPEVPVFLVGKSGGCGVTVRALEALPPDSVEVAVLIAPALSPGYDLTRALAAVRRELVVFWSPLDVIVLGLGTRIFGTIDRIKGVSAGMVGFRPPPGPLDEPARAQYAKLRQVRWGPRMAPTGYLGGHVGPDVPAFLRKYVAPLLVRAEAAGNPVGCQAGRAPRR